MPENQRRPAERFVVIGTSTGGLAALRTVLAELPANLPAAVLITMHIGRLESSLPDLLSHSTALRVKFAQDGDVPLNGHAYIAPPDRHLLLERQSIRLVRGAKENHCRPAIDPLFRSAAINQGRNVTGVILTGELDDGTVGLQAVKACGGIAIVQDPDEAQSPSMPLSALRFTQTDHCLVLTDIGRLLAQLLRNQRPDDAYEPISRRIEPFATEHEICAQGGAAQMSALRIHGDMSNLTCPDCGGSLWEMGRAPLRYRCHTGHSFTGATLSQRQDDNVEEAIWIAVRSLHEKQLLLQRQAVTARNMGNEESALEYDLASRSITAHATTLQGLITGKLNSEQE
jgi:two-component system chemotaxis response regulator CheB|nr:chemotaxis protein CheB [uncultured Pseudomonas sp.]